MRNSGESKVKEIKMPSISESEKVEAEIRAWGMDCPVHSKIGLGRSRSTLIIFVCWKLSRGPCSGKKLLLSVNGVWNLKSIGV